MSTARLLAFVVVFGLMQFRAFAADSESALSSLAPGCTLRFPFTSPATTILTCGSRLVAVRGLEDLRGHVRVRSVTQALEFVRFFTRGGIWLQSGVAVYAEPTIGFGPKPLEFIVDEATWRSCCFRPSVSDVGLGEERRFEIRRVLVDRAYKVFEASETVWPDGRWQIREVRRVPLDGRRLGKWFVPDI